MFHLFLEKCNAVRMISSKVQRLELTEAKNLVAANPVQKPTNHMQKTSELLVCY